MCTPRARHDWQCWSAFLQQLSLNSGILHGDRCHEIRRHVRRECRAYPQRGAHVKREVEAGNNVAVVVSAMAGTTNQLVEWVREASPLHDAREYDAVVATGEQITAGLLAIVLQSMGISARSWQGWQIPITTNQAHGSARIEAIDGARILERFEQGEVAVITGFQGRTRAQPDCDAWPGRIGYERGGRGDRAECRYLRHLHGR